jgi:hypothetical protein
MVAIAGPALHHQSNKPIDNCIANDPMFSRDAQGCSATGAEREVSVHVYTKVNNKLNTLCCKQQRPISEGIEFVDANRAPGDLLPSDWKTAACSPRRS